MEIEKYRDLTLVSINKYQKLVISCDSAGGIGNKENDMVKVSPEITGYFTTTVVMMELLSYGAKPLTIINNLISEMNPTGSMIIKGIKRALIGLNIDEDNFITGSTEENIPVTTTGIGITAVGIIDLRDWEKPRSNDGDIIVVIGIPKVGNEVKEDFEKTNMNIRRLLGIKDLSFVNEILPVGSKGIKYELEQMSFTNNLKYKLFEDIHIDLYKSAGPSTCVIASLKEDRVDDLENILDIPINKIGIFYRKEKK